MHSFLIDNARLVLTDRITNNSALVVENSKIAEILKPRQKRPHLPSLNLKNHFLAPGFIDLHVHGGLGRDAMEANLDAWNTVSRYHATGGTTALALATVAAPWKQTERVLKLASQKPKLEATELLGIHLEGTFLNPEMAGAQEARYLKMPDSTTRNRVLKHANVLTQVTLAPELAGARTLIRQLNARKILASAGHTQADVKTFQTARNLGLRHVTHLFNRIEGSDKQNPPNQQGAVEYILNHSSITAEIIADGVHVPVALLKEAYLKKGADGLILVTDATAGAGLREGMIFRIGKQKAVVRQNHAVLQADVSILAGSTLRMIDAVRLMVEQAGVPLHEAVRMVSLNPAKKLHLHRQMGCLCVGNRADFAVFDQNFRIAKTFLAGQPVLNTKP